MQIRQLIAHLTKPTHLTQFSQQRQYFTHQRLYVLLNLFKSNANQVSQQQLMLNSSQNMSSLRYQNLILNNMSRNAFSSYQGQHKDNQGSKKHQSKQQKKNQRLQQYETPQLDEEEVKKQQFQQYLMMQQMQQNQDNEQYEEQEDNQQEEDDESQNNAPTDNHSSLELLNLIKSQNLKTMSSFEIIHNILGYAMKSNGAITEKEVEKHFQFFLDLINKLKIDITRIIQKINQYGELTIEVDGKQFSNSLSGQEGEQIADSLQFLYAMAYDDQELWSKIYEVISELTRVEVIKVIPILKMLDTLKNFKDDNNYESLSKQQIKELEQKLVASMESQVEEIETMSRQELISLFFTALKYTSPQKNEQFFDRLDKQLGQDVLQMTNSEFGSLMVSITNFNLQSENEEEIIPELIMMQGETHAMKNLPFYQKDDLLGVVGAYCTTGLIDQMTDLNSAIQQELLTRTSHYNSTDISYIVKCYSLTKSGTPEFYASLDKFIGNHLDYIDPTDIYPILKSFYDSGYARNKLFIKLHPQIINNLDKIDVNELVALLRLYHEMNVEQITFYEEIALHFENHLNSIDETGLVNAIIVFKSIPTKRQLSVVTDLEQILMGNMNALSPSSVSTLLYHYSKFEDATRKNNKITDALKQLAIKNIQTSHQIEEQMSAYDTITLFQAFTKCDVAPKYIAMVCDQIPGVVEQYQDEDLQMIIHQLAELQANHEGFDKGFNAVQRELTARKSVEVI